MEPLLIVHGAFYGILLIFAIYNLAIFCSVRDGRYLHLGLLCCAAILWQLSVDDLTRPYLWPDLPAWASHSVGIFAALLFAISVIAIARTFRARHPQGDGSESPRHLDETARRENEAKSRFLASASHDLRQPIHALGLFVESLEHRVRDPDVREIVEKIQASHVAMEEMFDAVLDISKLDAGALEPNLRDFPAAELLDPLRAEFQGQADLHELRFRVMSTSLWLSSDPLLLQRILRNLVSNALRYTDHGRVTVGCRRAGTSAVRIEVYDTGRGIPETQHSEVFQEYRRVEGPGRPVTDGLGLGLAIVDRLARLLEHPMEMRSAPGQGSVFSVRVPRGSPPEEGSVAEPAVATGGDLEGRVILVVDEDPYILDGMGDLLKRWGCTAVLARSLLEAIAAAQGKGIEAIVADYDLGLGTTGVGAIASVRGIIQEDVPAMLITGDTSTERSRDSRSRGLILLHKPVSPGRLRAALSQLLRRRVGAR